MKLENIFEMSYFINLDERKDRLDGLDSEWYKINFYPERFSAIKNNHGPTGCYLSHLEVLKKARDANKNILIFEDDVSFDGDCRQVLEEAMDELWWKKWDMMYLGGNILRPFFQTSKHWARLSQCQSTHAYGVSKKFLPELVNFLEKNPPNITHLCIDQLYADYVVPHCVALIIVPMIAIQKSDFSTIEGKDMTYEIPIQRYNHFLVRQ